MSAFFVWLEFGGQAIDRSIAVAMLSKLDGFGGDAKELLLSDNLAIGSQARWTTDEDIGERQPLFNSSQTECLLFDGRIDNREHLIAELALESTPSDGQLFRLFLERFGESRLAEVIGPFVFVLLDLQKGSVLCARDAMGGRYLVYGRTSERLIIASSELALLAHPAFGHNLNPAKMAAWLSNHQEGRHSAYLRALTVLDPGCSIFWRRPETAPGQLNTFYRPDPARRLSLAGDAAYAAEFRRLLDLAVQRRIRSRGMVGSMLSGGLDSVPITISAAKLGGAERLLAYSWVFERAPHMDERSYSGPVCERLGLRQRLVVCDDLWPRFDADTHNNPLFPFSLPYSEFQQQTFRQAQADGVTVMLSGLQGDLLYETGNQQVLEAIKRGNLQQAFDEFKHARAKDDLSIWGATKRFLLAPLTWVAKWLDQRHLSNPTYNDMLTPKALDSLTRKPHWLLKSSYKALRPLQYRVVLDGFAGEDGMLGREMENKYRVERRYPFRDRQLCEFMLSIPTDQLSKLGVSRPIVKRAYANDFTQELAVRNDKTQFGDSLLQGIKRDKKWRGLLTQVPSYWQQTVKECYLLDESSTQSNDLVVMWQCAYYNFWHQLWYDSPVTTEVGANSSVLRESSKQSCDT